MAVPNSTHRVDYNGDGSTTEFAVPFYFLANADVTVTHVSSAGTETTWTEGLQYTLTGAGDSDGGALTATTAPSSGTRLVIRRKVTQTQEIKYPANDPFPSSSHEQALDKLTMIAQEQQEQIDRSLKRPVGDPTDVEMTLPTKADRASKVLGFDSNGRPVALSQLDKSADTVTAAGTSDARSLAAWMAALLAEIEDRIEGDADLSAALDALGLSLGGTQASLNAHVGNTSNPHAVTKAQVGLGNVLDLAQMYAVAASLAQNGYLHLSDGTISFVIQWGLSPAESGKTRTVTFPIAFPNEVFSVVAQEADATDATGNTRVFNVAASGFDITLAIDRNAYWIAAGH